MSFLRAFKHITTVLTNAPDYEVVDVLNEKQMTVQAAKKYVFDVESAVTAGEFTSLLLELFTDRGYVEEGKIVVCPASYNIMQIGVVSGSTLSVIPVQNIDEVRGNENLRPLIINAPVKFLTELPTEELK